MNESSIDIEGVDHLELKDGDKVMLYVTVQKLGKGASSLIIQLPPNFGFRGVPSVVQYTRGSTKPVIVRV